MVSPGNFECGLDDNEECRDIDDDGVPRSVWADFEHGLDDEEERRALGDDEVRWSVWADFEIVEPEELFFAPERCREVDSVGARRSGRGDFENVLEDLEDLFFALERCGGVDDVEVRRPGRGNFENVRIPGRSFHCPGKVQGRRRCRGLLARPDRL